MMVYSKILLGLKRDTRLCTLHSDQVMRTELHSTNNKPTCVANNTDTKSLKFHYNLAMALQVNASNLMCEISSHEL